MSEHDDEELTPEEQAEAAALVDALERGSAREALPEDALETAALLRYSRDGGELSEERRRAVLDDVWANAKRPAAQKGRSGLGWLKWLLPVGGLGAAAAAALLFVTLQRAAEPAPVATELPVAFPPPTAELLRAQAAVAGGDMGEIERLDREMRAYRGAVYAALDTRYGGTGR